MTTKSQFICPFCGKESEPWRTGYCCKELNDDTVLRLARIRQAEMDDEN